MLGKTEARRRGQQRMRWLDGTANSIDMSLSKFRELVKDREAWCCSPWDGKELDMTGQLLKRIFLKRILDFVDPSAMKNVINIKR